MAVVPLFQDPALHPQDEVAIVDACNIESQNRSIS
jgi:hypothetical protein